MSVRKGLSCGETSSPMSLTILISLRAPFTVEDKGRGCPLSRAPNAMTDDCGQPAYVGEMEPKVHGLRGTQARHSCFETKLNCFPTVLFS